MPILVVMFVGYVVWYFIDWALHPDWSYRRVVEVGLIILGILFIYLIGKDGKEAYPQLDEPNDVSPADRVRKIRKDSDDQAEHRLNQ